MIPGRKGFFLFLIFRTVSGQCSLRRNYGKRIAKLHQHSRKHRQLIITEPAGYYIRSSSDRGGQLAGIHNTHPPPAGISYTEYAGKCRSNRVYPLSIVEGMQDGRIIPDDENNVKAVLFWHYCGFAYLSGDVGEAFLQRIYEDYFLSETERRFILITDDPKVIQFFSNKEDIESDKRVEYRFNALSQEECKCDYKIERIDELIFDKIRGRIIPSFSWSGKDRFLENGFGYVAMDGDRLVATAFSAAVSSDE